MSSPESRWVFDTNAIVSALLFEQSHPGKALLAGKAFGIILVSQETAAELSEVLARPKFDRYVTREERERFLILLLRETLIVDITEEIRVCRDPDDDKFLELALNGQASCLISGDEDLLTLNPFRDIPILSPAAFLEFLSKSKPE